MWSSLKYGSCEYWEERYSANKRTQEWYQSWADLKHILKDYIQTDSRILNIGCGRSRLQKDLLSEGYSPPINIDICPGLIAELSQEDQESEFRVQDVRELDYPDESFDVVLDKATFDTLICVRNPKESAHAALTAIYRVLAPRGLYICISHAPPAERLPFFSAGGLDWEILKYEVPKPPLSTASMKPEVARGSFYIYICTKPCTE